MMVRKQGRGTLPQDVQPSGYPSRLLFALQAYLHQFPLRGRAALSTCELRRAPPVPRLHRIQGLLRRMRPLQVRLLAYWVCRTVACGLGANAGG